MSKPLISVITVVFNDVDNIAYTVNSVIKQTFDDYEYIVIDGASTDGTLELLERMSNNIQTLVSEKDKGIYYAMEKGLELARGSFISFINSGDIFSSDNILLDVSQYIKDNTADIYFGDYCMKFGHYEVNRQALDLSYLKKRMITSHQAIFFRAEIIKKLGFNKEMQIAADYYQICQIRLSGAEFLHIPLEVSKVTSGGLSDERRLLSLYEAMQASSLLSGKVENTLYYAYRFIFEMSKKILKATLQRLVNK